MIDSFRDKYYFLSNFYPCEIKAESLTFNSSEAYYQSFKVLDIPTKLKFSQCTASKAKKLGQEVILRPDWEEIKIDVMRHVLKAKFDQNQYLKEELLATGDEELVEGNWWGDRFWGIFSGAGRNWLGVLLMELRTHYKLIREEKKNG